jgi:hypothetical protein
VLFEKITWIEIIAGVYFFYFVFFRMVISEYILLFKKEKLSFYEICEVVEIEYLFMLCLTLLTFFVFLV